jgi:putative DNA primase/helicase
VRPTDFIHQVAGSALGRFEDAMHWLGLAGKFQGHEYLPTNPKRGDSKPGSFSINRDTGTWSDFATDDKGGDLVALAAYLFDLRQGEAATRMNRELGLGIEEPDHAKRPRKGEARAGNTDAPTPPTKPRQADPGPEAVPSVCIMPVPDDAPAPPAVHSRHGKPSRRYAYTGADGRVNFYHDRYEPKRERERKQFSPLTLWREAGGGYRWQFKAPPEPRPLYGLPELAAHLNADAWLVEGEKAAEALAKLRPGVPVLTWQGGAQAVGKSDLAPLAGRRCIVFPDNDAAGAKAADLLAKRLRQVGVVSIHLVNLVALAQAPAWEGEGEARQPILTEGPALAAGDDAADLVARQWTADHFALFLARPDALQKIDDGKKATAPGVHTSAQEQEQAAMPRRRFVLDERGVWYFEPEKSPRWICAPLDVVAMVRDPHNQGWALLVAFKDPDGHRHRVVISMSLFRGDGAEVAGLLLDQGLNLAPRARALLVEYLQTADTPRRARITGRTGWHDSGPAGGVFVLPELAIGGGEEEWLFEAETPAANTFTRRGSLKGWREHVAGLCVGNSRLVFSVSLAFASPLLWLLGGESGGFHLRSASSDGKTTALRVAASVCGGADYMQRWRATDNGLEGLAILHCDAPFLLDELAQIDPRAAGEAAYMLANGSGKTRAGRTGAARERSSWRLLFLSAGEIGLAEHMGEAGKTPKAGQELRLAEIPADAGAGLGLFENLHGHPGGNEFSKALADAIRQHHGTAFPAWLERLAKEQADIPDTIKAGIRAFEARQLTDQSGGQARRVAYRFALVGAAGELATAWGLTGWPDGEAMQAAATCFRAWIERRGGEGNQEERAMLSQVREFLRRYGESAFSDWDRPGNDSDKHAPRSADRAGYRRYDGMTEETEYFIFNETWRTRICKGFDHAAMGRLLVARGYAEAGTEHGREWLVKKDIPTEGRPRVVHILPALFEDDS